MAKRDHSPPARPGGITLVGTPSCDGLFERIANVLTGGHLDRKYYSGGNAHLDAAGFPIMNNPVSNDHVFEVTMETMPITSGGKWFHRHSFLRSVLTFAEALHSGFRFRAWADRACMMVRVPGKTTA